MPQSALFYSIRWDGMGSQVHRPSLPRWFSSPCRVVPRHLRHRNGFGFGAAAPERAGGNRGTISVDWFVAGTTTRRCSPRERRFEHEHEPEHRPCVREWRHTPRQQRCRSGNAVRQPPILQVQDAPDRSGIRFGRWCWCWCWWCPVPARESCSRSDP